MIGQALLLFGALIVVLVVVFCGLMWAEARANEDATDVWGDQ